MTEAITLGGCSPTPLASFLKAVGILRLVAEQADREARGYWTDDQFVLQSVLDADGLQQFLLSEYRPTPIISPWNGRAGFLEGEGGDESQRRGAVIVRQVKHSRGARFEDYRHVLNEVARVPVIESLNRVRVEAKVLEAEKKARKPYDAERLKEVKKQEKALKGQLLTALRSELSDKFLDWLDACMALTDEEPAATPLLGSGGNEGSMDYSVNHLITLSRLIDFDTDAPTPEAMAAIADALHSEPSVVMLHGNPGFLSPAGVGGPNMANGYMGSVRENAWNTALMLEGALLFAATVTRRLESSTSQALSFPFIVRAVCAGHAGVVVGESARPELWLPLWSNPLSLTELRSLVAEGRATVSGRQARDGLDMARSIAALGVDRGITDFQRYGFFERRGQGYYLATPLARVPVRRNRTADLIDQLDRGFWLSRFRALGRSRDAPARIGRLVRRLEDALFDLTAGGAAPQVQAVLTLLGQAQSYLRESRSARADCPDVPLLGEDWLARADDGSPEFSLARALAGIHAAGHRADGTAQSRFPMHSHFVLDDSADQSISGRDVTWGRGSLEDNLYRLLHRRLLWAESQDLPDKPLASWGLCDLESVRLWLERPAFSRRIALLLPGLVLARQAFHSAYAGKDEPLPAVFRLLKPLFCTDVQLRRVGLLAVDRSLPLPAELVEAVRNGRGRLALEIARRRLRSSGSPLAAHNVQADRFDGPRLLGALLVPLSDSALRRLTAPLRISERQDLATAD